MLGKTRKYGFAILQFRTIKQYPQCKKFILNNLTFKHHKIRTYPCTLGNFLKSW